MRKLQKCCMKVIENIFEKRLKNVARIDGMLDGVDAWKKNYRFNLYSETDARKIRNGRKKIVRVIC